MSDEQSKKKEYSEFEQLLKETGLKKTEFAKITNTSYNTVKNWDKVSPNTGKVVKAPQLAIAFLEVYKIKLKYDIARKSFEDTNE